MKRLLNLSIFPVIILGTLFSVGLALYKSDSTYAINCPAGQVAIVDIEDGDRLYARCAQQDVGVSSGCPRSGDAPNLTIGVRGGMVWQDACFAPAASGATTINCSQHVREGLDGVAYIEDGREKCSTRVQGGEPCPAGQVKVVTGTGNACKQAANPADAANPGGGDGGDGDAAGENGEDEEEEEPTCGTMATNVGWYMCPLLNAATEFADGMWILFENMLIIPPLQTGGDTAALYTVWGTLKNLANVILTIIFLAVIFSQVSNVGISNYGIKKMLPKLLIAAVVINISFFLMQIAIDLSNILTVVVGDVIRGAAGDIQPLGEVTSGAIEDIVTGLIAVAAGGAAFGIAAGITGSPLAVIVFLVILMIPIVFGLVAGVLTLALRSLLLPVLVIFAPLAFAFQLLPNTKKISDKWSSITIGLLSFSVVAAIMYDGALLVVTILIASSENPLVRVTALASMFLLMFFLPFLAFKINPMSRAAFNGLRKGIGNVAKPATDRARKANREALGAGAKATMARFKSRPAPARRRFDPRRITDIPRNTVRAMDKTKRDNEMDIGMYEQVRAQEHREGVIGDTARAERMKETAAGRAYISKFESEAVSNREELYKDQSSQYLSDEFERALSQNDTVGMKAIIGVHAKYGGEPGVKEIKTLLADTPEIDKNGVARGGYGTSIRDADGGNGKLYENIMSDMANNHSGLMGKDLTLKKMMTDFHNDDGSVKMMSTDQARGAVTAKPDNFMADMTPQKFANLTRFEQSDFLKDSSLHPHMSQEFLGALSDKSNPTSQGVTEANRLEAGRLLQTIHGGGVAAQPSSGGGSSSAPTPSATGGNTTVNNTTTTTTQTSTPGAGSGFSPQSSPPSTAGQAPNVVVQQQAPASQAPPVIVQPPAGGITPSSTPTPAASPAPAPVTPQQQAPPAVNVTVNQPPAQTPIPGFGSGFGHQSSPPSATGQAPTNQPGQGGPRRGGPSSNP